MRTTIFIALVFAVSTAYGQTIELDFAPRLDPCGDTQPASLLGSTSSDLVAVSTRWNSWDDYSIRSIDLKATSTPRFKLFDDVSEPWTTASHGFEDWFKRECRDCQQPGGTAPTPSVDDAKEAIARLQALVVALKAELVSVRQQLAACQSKCERN